MKTARQELQEILFARKANEEKEKTKAKWGALSGGIGGAMGGAIIGSYPGLMHPEALHSYMRHVGKSANTGITEGLTGMADQFGEGWRKKEPTPEFGKNTRFDAAERAKRAEGIQAAKVQKRAIRRIVKGAGIGALTVGGLGALAGYASSRAGIDQRLSAREEFQEIIEFAGGYINTDEGVFKEGGIGAHLKRNTGAYVGGLLTLPALGVPGGIAGAIIDNGRGESNIARTAYEPKRKKIESRTKGKAIPVYSVGIQQLSAREELNSIISLSD
jgi:hypothetical protein